MAENCLKELANHPLEMSSWFVTVKASNQWEVLNWIAKFSAKTFAS